MTYIDFRPLDLHNIDINSVVTVPAINWNKIEDPIDREVWDLSEANIWWPGKVPLSKDVESWNTLLTHQQTTTMRIFTGLTDLDSEQGFLGAPALLKSVRTPHEGAVIEQFGYMEQVHAKSYSSIFSTLCSSAQISEAYEWAANNERLKYKKAIIAAIYADGDPLKIKIASVMLESFLFYSGFYLPLYWFGVKQKLSATCNMIKLIIR